MKIAIVKLSALGDIVHSMFALQFLRQKYPNARIDWVAEECFADILEHNPHIDNILKVNLKSLKKNKLNIFSQIKLIKSYAKNNYDLIIDAQGLLKSAITARLLGKNIAGFDKNSVREKLASLFYSHKVNISYDENTIDRNAKVLSGPLGFEISTQDILDKKPFLYFADAKQNIDGYIKKELKNIVFIVGSTWKSRIYPKEKLVKIINELKQNAIIVWGNENEKQDADWIEQHSSYAKALRDRLSLNDLKALIAKADLLIGNDTGPTHMAWGLNVPSITIFGCTPVNRVYETPINKVVKSDSKVNHFKLDKNDFSIEKIDEEEILSIARGLL